MSGERKSLLMSGERELTNDRRELANVRRESLLMSGVRESANVRVR